MSVASKLVVNGDRLNRTIAQLAEIGKLPSGSIRRLAFTPEDLQARRRVIQWMQDAGMTVHTDAAGNIIGRYAGRCADAPALATGSHIDTVPSGGQYDGVLGVLAGIEVVRVLRENAVHLDHPLEVIVFTDEESSMIGCRAIAGTVNFEEAAAAIAKLDAIGGDRHALTSAQRTREDMAAFVELHVEQGGTLEKTHKEVGIVQGVVGMYRYAITLTGQANHAGTTPMPLRKDALVAAAEVVLAVQQMALDLPGEPVATVGSLTVTPNAANIVPGRVEMTVDMRDLSPSGLSQMTVRLKERLAAIAAKNQIEIEIVPILQVQPSPASVEIQSVIERSCQQLGLSYCHLPSRAGHDALEIGRITDMGMIFVPSEGGVSHSAEEYTSPEQCVQGANVLLQTLLQLDQVYALPEAKVSQH